MVPAGPADHFIFYIPTCAREGVYFTKQLVSRSCRYLYPTGKNQEAQKNTWKKRGGFVYVAKNL